MELFWLEHKKLWRKRIVKICVLLCFVYIVIFGSVLSFQWFSFGSSDDYTSAFGNNFDFRGASLYLGVRKEQLGIVNNGNLIHKNLNSSEFTSLYGEEKELKEQQQ